MGLEKISKYTKPFFLCGLFSLFLFSYDLDKNNILFAKDKYEGEKISSCIRKEFSKDYINSMDEDEFSEKTKKKNFFPESEQFGNLVENKVENILSSIDYKTLDSENYNEKIETSEKPMMVFFYGDSKNQGNFAGQRGLAALVKTLNKEFPKIEVLKYKVSEKSFVSGNELNMLQNKYDVTKIPELLIYKSDSNGKTLQARIGGVKTFYNFQSRHEILSKNIIPYAVLE